MKTYEMLYEYYTTCSPKPFTTLEDIHTDDLESYMKQHIPQNGTCTRTTLDNGDVQYEVVSGRIRKVYIFTEV